MENAVTETVKKGLETKVKDHNEDVKDLKVKWNPKVTYKKLEKVFERGVGAYKTNPDSVRPNVTSPEQWAYARVNSFLYAMEKGKYRGGKHDTDLLPKDHPVKESMEDVENGKVRKNDNCPDGYEHQMPDGSYMCGKEHGGGGYNSSEELIDFMTEFLSDFISMIPMAALVAVMIMVSIGTFSWQSVLDLKKNPISSSIVMISTVIVVVFTHNLALGVFVGVLLAAMFFANKVARFMLIKATTTKTDSVRRYEVRGQVFFASSESFIASFDFKEVLDKFFII